MPINHFFVKVCKHSTAKLAVYFDASTDSIQISNAYPSQHPRFVLFYWILPHTQLCYKSYPSLPSEAVPKRRQGGFPFSALRIRPATCLLECPHRVTCRSSLSQSFVKTLSRTFPKFLYSIPLYSNSDLKWLQGQLFCLSESRPHMTSENQRHILS